MLEDPFGVLGHVFHVPDKNIGSRAKEAKSVMSLQRIWVSFQNPMCSVLLLSLVREIAVQKI